MRFVGALLFWLGTPFTRRRRKAPPATVVITPADAHLWMDETTVLPVAGVPVPYGRHHADNPVRRIVESDWRPAGWERGGTRPRGIGFTLRVPLTWTPPIGQARIAAMLDDTAPIVLSELRPIGDREQRWHDNLPALAAVSW